jgi:hypothetical protein
LATRQQNCFTCCVRAQPEFHLALLPPYPQPLRTKSNRSCLAGGEHARSSAWREPSPLAILTQYPPDEPYHCYPSTAAILRKRLMSARRRRSAGQATVMRKVSRMPEQPASLPEPGQRTMTRMECSYTASCVSPPHHRPAQGGLLGHLAGER